MSIICKVDNTEHSDRDALHKYLRHIKMTQEKYYIEYETRYDPYTKNALPFKNATQYLAAEFESKESLREWLRADKEGGKKWAIEFLRKRRESKSLVYPPSQVELHSLLAPTIRYYQWAGGYNKICTELGYTIRFENLTQQLPDELPQDAVLVEDTREQKPIGLTSHTVINRKLPYGDYGLDGGYDKGIYIERKSLADFISTISDRTIERKTGDDSNLARFSRELGRAGETGAYIVVLVEESIDKALTFNQDFHYSKHRVSPEHIFKNVRDLYKDFNNFQILFVNGREEMARAIPRLLSAGDFVRNADLQYLYETKVLTF